MTALDELRAWWTDEDDWPPSALYEAAIAEVLQADPNISQADAYHAVHDMAREWRFTAARANADRARAALDNAMTRPAATWQDVDEWTEADFRQRVGKLGYRAAAKLAHKGPTALLRRWQAVSGGKPWPSGRNAPPHHRAT